MRQSKLPLSLLNDRAQSARVHILDTEGFETTFGPKAQRKRPNLKAADMKVSKHYSLITWMQKKIVTQYAHHNFTGIGGTWTIELANLCTFEIATSGVFLVRRSPFIFQGFMEAAQLSSGNLFVIACIYDKVS